MKYTTENDAKNLISLLSRLLSDDISHKKRVPKWNAFMELQESLENNFAPQMQESSQYGQTAMIRQIYKTMELTELQFLFPSLLTHTNIAIIDLRKQSILPDQLVGDSAELLRLNKSIPVILSSEPSWQALSSTRQWCEITQNDFCQICNLYKNTEKQIESTSVAELLAAPINHSWKNSAIIYFPLHTNYNNTIVKTLLRGADTTVIALDKSTRLTSLEKILPQLKEELIGKIYLYPDRNDTYTQFVCTLSDEPFEIFTHLPSVSTEGFIQILNDSNHLTNNFAITEVITLSTEQMFTQYDTSISKTDEMLTFYKRMQANYLSFFSGDETSSEQTTDYINQLIKQLSADKERFHSELNQFKNASYDILNALAALSEEVKTEYPELLDLPKSELTKQFAGINFFKLLLAKNYNKANEQLVFFHNDPRKEWLELCVFYHRYNTTKKYELDDAFSSALNLLESASDTDELTIHIKLLCNNLLYQQDAQLTVSAGLLYHPILPSEWYYKGKYHLEHERISDAIHCLRIALEQGEKKASQLLFPIAKESKNEALQSSLALKGNSDAALLLAKSKNAKLQKFWLKVAASHQDLTAIQALANSEYKLIKDKWLSNLSYPKQPAEKCLVLECLSLHEYIMPRAAMQFTFRKQLGVLYYLAKNYDKADEYLKAEKYNDGMIFYILGDMAEFGRGTRRDTSHARVLFRNATDAGFTKARSRWEPLQKKYDEQKARREEMERQLEEHHDDVTYDSGCFVTTAVCSSLNKPDDCEELQLMRHFRDSFLLLSDNGNSLVMEYYRIAPEIIKKINMQHNAKDVYHFLYQNFILPSLDALKEGERNKAIDCYIRMVLSLSKAYDVECQVIPEQYKNYVGEPIS